MENQLERFKWAVFIGLNDCKWQITYTFVNTMLLPEPKKNVDSKQEDIDQKIVMLSLIRIVWAIFKGVPFSFPFCLKITSLQFHENAI